MYVQEKEDSNQRINDLNIRNEEQKYLMKLKETLSMKRRGDWEKVAMQVGISRENAMMAFKRIHSKYHYEVVAALENVIEERQKKISK